MSFDQQQLEQVQQEKNNAVNISIVHSCHISLFLYQLKCQIRIIELSLSCKSLNYCLHLCGVRESKRMLLQCSFGFVSKLRLPVYDNFRL